MKKTEVAEILNIIKFYDIFETFANREYPEINYGKRIGVISFQNLFDADANYTFNGEDPSFDYSIWTNTLVRLQRKLNFWGQKLRESSC